MSVKIRYKDLALGADKDAGMIATSVASISTLSLIPYGVNPPALATCEPNGWGLTWDYKPRDTEPIAYWSNSRSNDDCVFSSPPTITLAFSERYTSTGITVQFGLNSIDFCRNEFAELFKNNNDLCDDIGSAVLKLIFYNIYTR